MVSMSSSILAAATVLLASVAHADPVARPEAVPAPTPALSAMTAEGCYSSAGSLTFQNRWIYQTSGYCQPICVNLGKAVMATTNSTDCWCGDSLPPASDKADSDKCNDGCAGYDTEMCGGDDATFFSVYLTGTDNSVGDSSLSSSSSSTTTSAAVASQTLPVKPSVVTVGGQTIIVTAAGQAVTASNSAAAKSGGSNTAGIAAGVVVAVVAIAAIAGGVAIWFRNKRRREVEEEYRRNAAMSQPPASSAGQSSMTDTRLDAATMAQNRLSTGSIADNQDYSRRILKVTNA